jgi:hypothetical protein
MVARDRQKKCGVGRSRRRAEEKRRRRKRKAIQSKCDERGGASCIRIKGGEEGGLRARCDACL